MNTAAAKPAARPLCAHFSSGPCAKRPGWSLDKLQGAILGRSHRAKEGKAALKEAIELTRTVLEVPKDFLIGIMPASDTGAFEAALWTLLGAPVPDGAMRPRGVDVLAWESFGKGWVTDIVKQLKLKDVRTIEAPYGALPDLRQVDFSRDVVFTWNGTTSGVRVPNGDWIAADREGLTLVDATSAAFAQRLDWPKIDALTFSWQKVLGGEAQHGMLILSPRAIARLESYKPSWPLPKLFRMTKADASGATKVDRGIFDGETINTPSMLCVEDYLDALRWAKSVGGLSGLIERADANAKTLLDWVERTPWIANLATVPATRSNTSVCLTIVDPAVTKLDKAAQADFAKRIASRLDKEGVAKDIGAYRDAPAGLRIWTGSTIEQADVAALLPWLEWAFQSELRSLSIDSVGWVKPRR